VLNVFCALAEQEALGVPPKPYVGGAAVRHVVTGAVFTSNESPPDQRIPFHHGALWQRRTRFAPENVGTAVVALTRHAPRLLRSPPPEMALVPQPPSRIAFFCDVPAARGGETSILLSGALHARVAAARPAFLARLEARGLRYSRVLSEQDDAASAQGRGWRSTYGAATRQEAEDAMRATGLAAWEWLPDGSLRTTSATLHATLRDPRSDEAIFHNALAAVYLGWTDVRNNGPASVHYGDGAPLDAEDVAAVDEAMQALSVDIPWQQGDVMLLDNLRAMHARRPFTPPRRVLAYLCV
jgi:hypothetical protein